MKRNILRPLCAFVAALTFLPSYAQFFDTSASPRLFEFGVRAGFNTSNLSSPEESGADLERIQTNDTWGLGFTCGAVFDINLRRWISIQPGFFFETRTNKFAYLDTFTGMQSDGSVATFSKTAYSSFRIPVLVSAKFNIGPGIRWSVDLGPQFSYGLGGRQKSKVVAGIRIGNDGDFDVFNAKNGYFDSRKRFEVGYKIGTGLTLKRHYYVGVHYEQGLSRPWKFTRGGYNKCWDFTLGYDF